MFLCLFDVNLVLYSVVVFMTTFLTFDVVDVGDVTTENGWQCDELMAQFK